MKQSILVTKATHYNELNIVYSKHKTCLIISSIFSITDGKLMSDKKFGAEYPGSEINFNNIKDTIQVKESVHEIHNMINSQNKY
ncbi:hypothetical protein [Bathymodiolus japonicus methanotrophic gill symbiont]|uniref:hypothetical protein n=1 Tax=Bathymodiolus japonicus methanotrophic gill symbiont TaxID=113269 RepID=UPI001C8E42DB|nr:hypothetical protein [Bathymodiolus japonicus methanotrophic gill symbiont]